MIAEIVLIAFVLFLVYKSIKRPDNFPPGPRGLPLVGYIPFFGRLHPEYPFKGLMKLAEEYGPVAAFYMGPSQVFVSVCGFEACQEALRNSDLDGRPDSAALRARTCDERLGVTFVDGEFWSEQRRFTMRHLRDLGFGRTSSENVIEEEIHEMLDDLRASAASNPAGIVDFKGVFSVSIINVLWAIIGGERFQRNDAKFIHLLNTIEEFFRSGNVARANIPIPEFLLKRFPVLYKVIGARGDLFVTLQNFIKESIEEHEKDRSQSSPRDFIDVYLNELEKQGNRPSTFTHKQLISTIVDLFAAGSETSSNSVGFALLHLIHNPDVLRKVQEELDSVCGDSLPSLADRTSLPYTEAVLMESQRLSSIAPFTVPHAALTDTKLQGYTIPKGGLVMVNLYSIHLDGTYWKDPEVFIPERHLNDQGKVFKSDHFLPFGVGKRNCLGESLAKNTYYLFATAVMKTFNIERIANEELPTLDPINGFTIGYKGFRAVLRERSPH